MKIAVVAFDCDGVMFDTKDSNIAYYNNLLNSLSMPKMTPDAVEFVHMHTVDESISHIMKGDVGKIRLAQDLRRHMDYREFLGKMRMEPTLKSTLKRLRPEIKTAVATNRTDSMHHVLKVFGLTDDFDLVVCASDVPRPKPFPDPLLKVLSHFGARPETVLYVGDSALDEIAAAAVGIPFIAYRNRHLNAAYYIDRLDAVEAIIEHANGR
jgi:phosphoglycolate phosphatase